MSDFNPLSHAQIPTHRSSFDLSSKKLFTAKVGELLPVYWQIAIPGSKYRISADWFTRTVPVNTAAYTRIKEYYDFYAVPLRLISRALPQAFTQMSDYMTSAASSFENSTQLNRVPYSTLSGISSLLKAQYESSSKDDAGTLDVYGTCKILDYLGYGSFLDSSALTVEQIQRIYEIYTGKQPLTGESSNSEFTFKTSQAVNILPLLAYQKVYFDFYSNSQWENHLAYSYNVDYWNGNSAITLVSNMARLRYANYPKDYFSGVLPNSQYGDVAVLSPVVDTIPSDRVVAYNRPDPTASDSYISSVSVPASSTNVSTSYSVSSERYVYLNANLSALSIRATEFLQRWKEIVQFASKDYTDQIKAQFGVSAPEYMGNHAHYIGGWSQVLNINEVVNTNLDAINSEASIAGKGVSSNSGHMIDYTVGAEHCVIIGIYHAVPLLDWALSGQSPQLTVTSISDFPQPAFDQLGMQPVPVLNLTNTRSSLTPTQNAIGYNLRYWQWKSNIDTVHGAFRPNMLYQSWAAPVKGSDLYMKTDSGVSFYETTYRSFKVFPQQMNSIFSVQINNSSDDPSTMTVGLAYDQLLCNVNFQVYAVQNLDRNGLPY